MRRPLTYAALSAVLLVTPACQSDPEPRFSPPSESPSATTSTEATVSASPTPEPEPLSPEETVRAWVDARNAALQDGDTASMTELHASGCRGCSAFSDTIDDVYAAGGSYDTKGWAITGVSAEAKADSAIDVSIEVRTASGTTVPKAGAPPVTYAAGREKLRFSLAKEASGWRIDFILFL